MEEKQPYYFDENQINGLFSEKIEPIIKVNINNFNEENDQMAFSVLKYGNKKGECFNDNHYQNALSVFKRQYNHKNIFNIIVERIHLNNKKNIYIVDGMNFLTMYMKYMIDNKNNDKLKIFYEKGDINVFYNLVKQSDNLDIESILELDSEIGKNNHTKNLFRINFLRDIFEEIYSQNKNDYYIIFHHGFNYVESFVKGKLKKDHDKDLYDSVYFKNNYILISTYSKNSLLANICTYKGKINNIFKNCLVKKNYYNSESIERVINNEINYGVYFKQKNEQILQNIKNKYFDYVSQNNIISEKVCKTTNETDDYCIMILYTYLKNILNLNVIVLSNDKYGWTKHELINEKIMRIDEFLK